MTFYIDSKHKSAIPDIAHNLEYHIQRLDRRWSDMIFLCIGTDRITGDCLGPYIGNALSHLVRELPGIFVYGTLQQPVHALNLNTVSLDITRRHPHGLVIAVDASLGQKKHLGYVTITDGALLPGAGVRKKLPAVGHLHITGIVNTGGFMEHWMLQTTPLSTVITLADVITAGIRQVIFSDVL